MTADNPHPCRCETCSFYKGYVAQTVSHFCCLPGGHKPVGWIKLGRLDLDLIKKVGCASHPKAREWLMQDVIKELESYARTTNSTHGQSAFLVAINLIKNGVDKK